MNISEILASAAMLCERGWCKEYHAIDANAVPVDPRSEQAVCWCIEGAVMKVAYAQTDEVMEYLRDALSTQYVSDWNDQAESKEQVVRELRDAALRAREREVNA
jgi:hypothetical protein